MTIQAAPIAINHHGMFPAVTIAFNLRPELSLGDAVDAIRQCEGESGKPISVATSLQRNAQAFQASLAGTPILITASLAVIDIILGVLNESTIHPLTILSTSPRCCC
jgi:multidrug efflux pump subunit AcrB